MSYKATVLEILIASPSDVAEERKIIQETIHSWNSINSKDFEIVLSPIMWETHSTPEMGNRPQAIINEQMVTSCDILVGAFWTRIGTHTGVAESGTIEEIQQFMNENKPTMLYFSSVPVVMDNVDFDQYSKLAEFKKKCFDKGLVEKYSSLGEFREKLSNHLTRVVRRHFKNEDDSDIENIDGESKQVNSIKEQLKSTIASQSVKWTVERDSSPTNINEGKSILTNLGENLIEYRVLLNDKVSSSVTEGIGNVLRNIKMLERHRLYIDGGRSFKEFWKLGNEIFDELNRILSSF